VDLPRAFARSWLVDLKPRDIRNSVLSPGHTDTPGLDGLLNSEQKGFLAGETPLDVWELEMTSARRWSFWHRAIAPSSPARNSLWTVV
jgi:hypothetical protein